MLGAGTVLAKHITCSRASELDLDLAGERILTLLSVAYSKPVDPAVLGNIRRASAAWRDGETVLALIHLAHSALPPLPDENAADRLSAADHLLAAGIGGRDLLKLCGIDTTAFDLLKAGFNPAQPRVPAGNPDGGQWTFAGGPAAPDKYTPVKETPNDAKIVVFPDGKPISDPSSATGTLLAPPHADFREVYSAGRHIANSPFNEQFPLIDAAIGHGGKYDYQRDPAKKEVYDAYVHAANYSAGVYMAGAGYTLEDTLALAALYAFRHSSNYSTTSRFEWITRGWLDANAGTWK
ncbi:MAG: hypothetical protein AB7H71_17875 [Alphaproteobacteria bacterium]